jgi:tetratricopeptide (TPR) repeat protein
MRPHRWTLWVVSVVLTGASIAKAEETTLWQESLEPNLTVVEEQRRNIWSLLSGEPSHAGWVWGLTQANEAVERLPFDPELRFMRGRLLYYLDRWDESARELSLAIELDPDGPFASDAAFDLGVALTRLERFEEAGAAYDAFLEEAPWPLARSIALTNLAETQIARVLLEEALTSFRAAVAAEPGYTLAYFGLAVALDRIGEEAAAQAAMLHGLSIGIGMEQLDDSGVFYVPAWEIHYYRALAHEALGEPELARTQWQLFLSGGGASGPFAARARAHLQALDRQAAGAER